MEYSEKQLKIVTDACASIFMLVSASDGKISKKEEHTFLTSHFQSIKESKILNAFHDEVILECLMEHENNPAYLKGLKSLSQKEHFERIRKAVALIHKKHIQNATNMIYS